MIKFHYHLARKDVPRLGIRKGDRLCHVYSDTSLDELYAWGRVHGLKPEWVHRGTLPHYDAHGDYLRVCGRGVDRKELREDIRRWRGRRRDEARTGETGSDGTGSDEARTGEIPADETDSRRAPELPDVRLRGGA